MSIKHRDINDLVITALESGISYWAVYADTTLTTVGDDYEYPLPFDITTFDDKTITLTESNMRIGILLAAKIFGLSTRAFTDNHDADLADAAVQCALFGGIVYA